MTPWWVTVIASICSAIIAGLFSVYINKKKLNFEKQKYINELNSKAIETKPRLEIKKYSNFKRVDNLGKADCELLVLGILDFKEINGRATFFYDEKALDNKNLVYVEYELINKGKTEIEDICITSNLPRSMSVFNMEDKDKFIKEHFLNYEAWSKKRYIKENEIVKIRVYYVKNQIPTTIFGSPELIVWLCDVNGRCWSQVLNSPLNEIGIPNLEKYTDLKDARDTDVAIKCFRGELFW